MKTLTLYLVTIFFTTLVGHNPNTSSLVIKEYNGEWLLSASISSAGLVKIMQVHYQDSTLELSDDKVFLQKIEKYFLEHIQIEINKFYKVKLINFGAKLHFHAIEISFVMKNMPPRPDYWELNVSVGKEMGTHTVLAKIVEENQVSQLTFKKSKPKINLIRTQNHKLSQIH